MAFEGNLLVPGSLKICKPRPSNISICTILLITHVINSIEVSRTDDGSKGTHLLKCLQHMDLSQPKVVAQLRQKLVWRNCLRREGLELVRPFQQAQHSERLSGGQEDLTWLSMFSTPCHYPFPLF